MKKKFFLIFILILLASCGASNVNKKDLYSIYSNEELYEKGKKSLLNTEYTRAIEYFETIEGRNPFSEKSNKAIILASYSYYKKNDFDGSLLLIEFYKKMNFNKIDVEYMYFLEIMNNYKKISNDDKNLSLITNTISLINKNVLTFENNKYTNYVLKIREKLIELAVKRELEIVNFYMHNNNLIGALNHLKNIEKSYICDKYSDEINFRFFEIYKHINYKDGIKKYYLLLENNKESKWFKHAKNKI